jgi:hypothetical protein
MVSAFFYTLTTAFASTSEAMTQAQSVGWVERSETHPGPSHAAPSMDFAEFTIGPAQRVQPLAGPMASSGRTRWLYLSYSAAILATSRGVK